jgi:type I restriction enzyme S subunit
LNLQPYSGFNSNETHPIDLPQYIDTPFWTIDTAYYSEISEQGNPKFLYYLLTTINWYSFNEASGVPSLNANTVGKIEIFLPTVSEQQAIAEVLSDVDIEITALEARREKTRLLKQGMMQELLTGRIRLI